MEAQTLNRFGQGEDTLHILSKTPAQYIFRISVSIWSCTILACYFIATWLGHVPVWLPMISDCAVQAPERYIFRIGFISGANWLFYSSILYYYYFKAYANKRELIPPKLPLFCSALAAMAIAIVGAVNEVENFPVHSSSAVTFFFLLEVYMVMTTYQMRVTGLLNNPQFYLRLVLALLTLVTWVVYFLYTVVLEPNVTTQAVCEWNSVLYIFVFEMANSFLVSDRIATATVEMSDHRNDCGRKGIYDVAPGCVEYAVPLMQH